MTGEARSPQTTEQSIIQGRDLLMAGISERCIHCPVAPVTAVEVIGHILEECRSIDAIEPAYHQVMGECTDGADFVEGLTPCTNKTVCKHPQPNPNTLFERIIELASAPSPQISQDAQGLTADE